MISSPPHDSSRAAGSFGKNMRFMEQGVSCKGRNRSAFLFKAPYQSRDGESQSHKADKIGGETAEDGEPGRERGIQHQHTGKQDQRDPLQLIFYLKTPFCYKTGRAYACSAHFFLSRSICFW